MDNTISGVDSRRIARGTQRVRCWLRVRLGRARNSSCSLVQSDSPPRARPPPLSADSCFSLRRTKAYRSVLSPFELEPPLRSWSISSPRRISETEQGFLLRARRATNEIPRASFPPSPSPGEETRYLPTSGSTSAS